ncbi:uncharacterized protein C8Q71DRAFT_859847 [Rhodofomes roseus]|uniref:Uncharacterized protein n=1 Tax=Rhodofomes roseus TaxID=34475 RepID=A0A4Y9YD04_9APHY|nr:uncharacterized protein C8Q71DRAFT_859847 [Rhodofomes roseus]KAH9834195.1 hypothetical protein C8Q71DRAFT_859847 [Rhodofomes roseus]TFY59583.1 hypothetical protein EVJ58_g5688 [Rhodofomes roseus]
MDSKDRDLAESHRREARSNKEREDWRMLAEARQRKLEEAQTFLESSDVTAENDIAEAVSALNAEIYQVIKRVPEGCRISTGSTVDIVATDRAGTIIGSRMMDLIRTFPPRGGDWVVMEIALQATITAYVARVISSWSPHCSSDEVIDPIYNRILRSESQSVAGRWRILTRKYVVSSSTSIKDWETRHVRQLLEDASTILGASGAISWDNNDLKDGLEIIVHAAMKIRRMVGEDVVRSEYEVFAVKRKANFDPDVMVDEYASPQKRKKKAGVHVICPLTLGLRRREGENRSGTKGRSEVTVKTLVKPQVVLDTVIDDLGFLDDRE